MDDVRVADDRGAAGEGAPGADATGRRDALRALGAAGVALVAAGGLSNAAGKDKKPGGKGRKNKKQKDRKDGQPKQRVTAEAPPPGTGPPGDLPAPLIGPTGPTGPTGSTGADSQVTGPTGAAGASGVQSRVVTDLDRCTSRVYDDLAHLGPAVAVDVPTSGNVLVVLTAFVGAYAGTLFPDTGFMSFESTGGLGDVEASDRRAFTVINANVAGSAIYVVAGLSPGRHTFTAKYRTDRSDDAITLGPTFHNRAITVIPLP